MAKILAVDDEPAILEMIESILNKDGHLVTKVLLPHHEPEPPGTRSFHYKIHGHWL